MTLSFSWLRLPGLMASLLGVGVAAGSLGGCAPDLGPAPVVKPVASYAASHSLAAPSADWPADAWWTVYGDPQLNEMEAQALVGSPDLAVAAARVGQAQALVEQQGAEGKPQVAANGSIQTHKQSLNEGFPPSFKGFLPAGYHTQTNASIDLEWDLDFFGANRARLAAATSAADAARADEAAARLQLSTNVAAAWAELARLYADRDAAVDAVRIRSQTFDLVGRRLRNGLETRGELAQAEGGVPAAQADVEALDRAILEQRHAMAALIGAGPDAGLALPRPKPLAARVFGLPSDVAVDLVGRRPDLTAARLRAEAAASRTKGAKRDFYPNITLGGSYGLASLGINTFTQTPDSIVGTLGPALRLPIFSMGRLESAYRGRRGEYDEAVASYDRTLANALRDVSDAATGVQSLQAQIASARSALASDEEAYRVAQLRYTGGLSPFLNVLTVENTLIAQRRTVADLEGQAAGVDVALVRALGGGYRDSTMTTATGPAPMRTASR